MITVDNFDRAHAEFLMKAPICGLKTIGAASWHSRALNRCRLLAAALEALPAGSAHGAGRPTATVIEQDFYVELVRLAKKYKFLVISDFAYADICYDGYQAPSFLATPGAIDVGVEFTSMSKSYSMAGWRIGFCCGNREMVRALATIKGYYDYGIFQPIQIAAIVAMRHCDAAVESITKEYQHRRDVLCEGLTRLGWNVTPPKAGMFVWTEMPEQYRQMGSIEFAMKLLNEGGVAVSPGRGFGEDGENCLRLAIVENSQRLRQSVRQIDKCLNNIETESPV